MFRCILAALIAIPSVVLADSRGPVPKLPDSPSEVPVIGGTSVPPGKWPDAVAVLGAQGSCTGTLIGPQLVLTAGHCAEINPTQVIINTTDYAASGGIHANVQSTTAHPSWETSYDVSLVVLSQPVAGVTPRKLGTSCTFQGFSSGKQVHLVGFGLTDTAGMGNNTKLNETMAPVIDADCSGGNGCNTGVAPGGEFVAGGNQHDSCFGDSGGPVYLDTANGPIVIGAVSRGVNNSPSPCGYGGIYVRTDKIVQWIQQTAAGKSLSLDSCNGVNPPGEGSGSGSGSGDVPTGPVEPQDITGGCSSTSDASLSVIALLAVSLALRPTRKKRFDARRLALREGRVS